MNTLDLNEVCEYVNDQITVFHNRRISSIEGLNLDRLLRKNPYLFKAKDITTAGELMENLLMAFLSSSEE
ncbi:MAG: PmeII family type II restriction endonuclease [Anaerolineae bacterium]|nr:PmeII family type II restriction endonuclease [Anaerolineae bacterium]